MADWVGREMTDDEVALLYREEPGQWFLFQVLAKNSRGRATHLKVVAHHRDKDVLRDILMESEVIDAGGQYVFVYADPDGKCEL
ncbi:MAG: hypothetical protein OEY56_09720 [Cyclobacteriaceae bacterium]|nr:hypothetical protein [Cyclobacteriaceae bacterium]